MRTKKSKARVVSGDLYEKVSLAVHKQPIFNDKPSLADTLRAIAAEQNHLLPDENFVPELKGSFLKVLRTFYPEREDGVKGGRMAECSCVCGTVITIPHRWFTQKTVRSCGCQKESIQKRLETYKEAVERVPPGVTDLRNMGEMGDGVFGLLRVMTYVKIRENHKWVIECACGERFVLSRQQFKRKQIQHCGSPQCSKLYNEGYTRQQVIKMFVANDRDNPYHKMHKGFRNKHLAK